MITAHHAKYFAHQLTKQGGSGIDRLTQSLFNSNVDLNPHQIEAALFALRSPFSKGVILADEVGLGKTIEAGLVLCQYWAERKRKLLIICPAALRKQWQIELEEKFGVPSFVLDSKVHDRMLQEENISPLDHKSVIIMSYNYAAKIADSLRSIDWDIVVIDEAHKLRNSHRESNKNGQRIRWAIEDRRKILLTATPLQNSLTELYGIATVIDDNMFGDLPTFRTLYANSDGDLDELKERLSGFTRRTLRKDVLEFIKYTERKLITLKFKPTDDEHGLYQAVSEFLQREDTYSLPSKQKHLTIIVLRKVLASSPTALASTLTVIKERLVKLRENAAVETNIAEQLLADEDIDEELLEELLDEQNTDKSEAIEIAIDKKMLETEILEIDRFINWANSIGINTKTKYLLKALEIGYDKMKVMGANEKAVIFTESRKTQDYLKNYLESNGFLGQVVTFSGVNRDPQSAQIYNDWLERNSTSGKVSGSRAIDLRHAIVDFFRDEAKIMIATEAAAEGINLQFCSLMINFDLPWNPQRVEQRIGRIHRYGQKHDVVVINFLNERNAVDLRIYDLLRYKFNLFEGLFGASDEILGKLDSSASFEKKILDLIQSCRTEEQIEAGFRKLQEELDIQIQLKLDDTKKILLENFDENVHSKLKVDYNEAVKRLDDVGKKFWRLTKSVLNGNADFNDEDLSFYLRKSPEQEIHKGLYALVNKSISQHDDRILYKLSHPLGEYCLNTAKQTETESALIEFNLSGYKSRIFALEGLLNCQGWLTAFKLNINSVDSDEYILICGYKDDGTSLPPEVLEQFFKLDGELIEYTKPDSRAESRLKENADILIDSTKTRVLEEQSIYFNEKRDQLFRWAEDIVAAAERDLKQIKAELRVANREASSAETPEELKLAQEKIKQIEKRKRAARNKIFDVEDDVEEKRDKLINALEKKLVQNTTVENLFTIKWKII